jgi:hypothetical protein
MSTIVQTIFENRPNVIVRAFRSEPVRLRALSSRGDIVEVFNSSEDTTIGLPRATLFQFDEELFKKLRNAYDVGDQKRLSELWSKAMRFEASA